MHKFKQRVHFGADVSFGPGAQVLNEEGIGAVAVATVVAKEYGVGFMHKTILTLSSVVVPIVSVTTGLGIGGVKLYDFPVGRIKIIGAEANLALSVASGKQADFTDATPQGSLGLGSVIITNPAAFSTDATDDDIAAGVAYDMASYADSSVLLAANSGDVNFASPLDLVLNASVAAADIDNDVTTEMLASGLVVVHWVNLTAGT